MATYPTVMKNNIYLSFIIISGLTAFILGAGLAAAFGVLVGAAIIGMTCNDYSGPRIVCLGSAI